MKDNWRQWLWRLLASDISHPRHGQHTVRPALEALEDRTLLSAWPVVQSINRTAPAGPVTNATSVTYTVTFSEAVTGVDPTDFPLAVTGTRGGNA